MDAKELLTLYIKNLKPNTKRSYQTTLKLWEGFLKGKTYGKAGTLDAFYFYDYLCSRVGIDGKKAANGTVHSRVKTMKKVYQVLASEGLCKTNIFHTSLIKLKNPRENMKRQTQSIPQSALKQLLKHKPRGLKERQALCIIALMYGGGLRISEALGLKLGDIRHTDKGTLFVNLKGTKNGEDARQPLPRWCFSFLTKQITQRSLDSAGQFLFVSYASDGSLLNQKLDTSTAFRHTKKLLLAMGLNQHSNHSLRKTGINFLFEEGYAFEEIQDFSRHKTPAALMVYRNENNIEKNLAVKIVLAT